MMIMGFMVPQRWNNKAKKKKRSNGRLGGRQERKKNKGKA